MDTYPNPESSKIQAPLFTIGLLFVLTIGVSLLPSSWFGIKPAQKTYAKIDLSSISMEDIANDTDGDGSLSWKEIVSVNMTNEETAALKGREPDPKVIAALNDPNNLTASFSKNLYVASAYLTQNSVSDALSQQETLNQLMEEEAKKLAETSYGIKDLKVAPTEDKTSIKNYGNTVASILGNLITSQTTMDTIGSVQAYIETKDSAALPPLVAEYKRIDSKIEKMLALEVPLSAVTYHLLALNRLNSYRNLLYNLSQIVDDPLRASLSIDKYAQKVVATVKIYENFASYFSIKNIAFGSKEAGYVFVVGYTIK